MAVERSQRKVEKTRSGRFFYLVAAVFVVTTLVVVGLWVRDVLTVNQLRSELKVHLEEENYSLAVEVADKLISQSPRWKRRDLRADLGEIRVKWAEYELSQNNYRQASAQAVLAAEDHLEGDLSERIHLVKAGAAIGQLKHDLLNLTFDERLARCRSIIDKYSGTDAASEATELLEKYERISHAVREEWEQLIKKISLLKENGRILEAIKLLQDFRGKCDKDLLQELTAKLERLNDYAKTGYCELQIKIELTSAAQLPPSSVGILVASQDFVPVFRRDNTNEPSQVDSSLDSVDTNLDVFFTTEQGMLYCLCAQTGTPLWGVHQGMGMEYLPVRFEKDVVCVSDWGRSLSRLNSLSGKVVWSVVFPTALACPPIMVGADVITLDQEGHLRIFDSASGRVRAERKLGGGDLSHIATDGYLRLIASGPERTVLFEKLGDEWLQIGSLLTSKSHVEKVYLIDRFLCVLPRRLYLEGKIKRTYLWRDRSITPIEAMDFGNDWHLLDQGDGLQVWVDSRGTAHCTQIDRSNIETPLRWTEDIAAFNIRDARVIGKEDHLSIVTAGTDIQLWNLTRQSGTTPFKKDWSRSIVWQADHLRIVGRLQILNEIGNTIIIRGDDRYGPVFASLSLDTEGEIEWMSRLGPNAYLTPVVFNDVVAWPDGESGILVLNTSGDASHTKLGFSPSIEPRIVSLVADAKGCLAYSGDEVMLFGEQLEALWSRPAKASGTITTACLLDNDVVAVTEQAELASYDRMTGEDTLGAVDIPDAVSPCSLLRAIGGRKILLIGQSGAAVEASIVVEGEVRKWSFQNRWDAVPDIKEIANNRAGVFAYTDLGWLVLPQRRGPFGPEKPNLLYAGEDIVLASSLDEGSLACVDLSQMSDLWSSQISSPAIWANRISKGNFVVLTQTGQLLALDLATGAVIKQIDCLGSPTSEPAIFGGNLWIPLSGYRLLKVSLTDFDSP